MRIERNGDINKTAFILARGEAVNKTSEQKTKTKAYRMNEKKTAPAQDPEGKTAA